MKLAVLLLLSPLAVRTAAAVEHVVLQAPRPAVVEIKTAALILSGQQGGALPIAVAELPRGAGAMTLVVEIDGAALLELSPAMQPLAVEVFAYVLGAGLDVLEVASCAFEVDAAGHRGLLADAGLKVLLPLAAPAGEHPLRVLARAGDAFGLRGVEAAPGAPAAGTPAAGTPILGPVFHEAARPWLLAVAGDAELPAPFGLDGVAPLPALQMLAVPGETLSAQVFFAGESPESLRLRALVRSPGGDAVEVPLELGARDASAAGRTAVTVSLTAPELPPGLYEIAVATYSGRSSFVPFFIGAGATTNVAGPRPAGADAIAPATLSRPKRELLRTTADGYLEVLRQLAAGDRRAALATLDATESRVVDVLDAEAVAVLAEGESQTLADLPVSDWGGVLPLILLHLDASRAYARERRLVLAHHANRMTVDLAAAYAAKLATPEAAGEAAVALSSLAGHLLLDGSLSYAERLFRQALTLADDEAALLALASIYEKRGLYAQAMPLLEAFVAARPAHPEGQLRLALQRSRLGRTGEARQALERLAAGPDSSWVTLLAYEELARLDMHEHRLAQAADLLRRALERWPGHPTLTLQLAWVLDAQGELLQSRQLLADLDLAATPDPARERWRYNRWPLDLLLASRRQLAATATLRLDDLGHWLAIRQERE